jgi:RNA polymerase sigma-70 factor (ECF subfamily)
MRTWDWEREQPRRPAASAVDLLRLARDVADGQAAAVEPLLEAVAPHVLRVVRAVLGSAHPETEDIVQDSLLGFLRALASFRGESSVTHFAARIAFRHALEARRRSRSVGNWLSEYHRMAEVAAPSPPLPSELLANDRRRAILTELLVDLPKPQAEALLLRAVVGLSVSEIAEGAGCPEETIRSRLRLAKNALRARIDGDARLRESLEDEP